MDPDYIANKWSFLQISPNRFFHSLHFFFLFPCPILRFFMGYSKKALGWWWVIWGWTIWLPLCAKLNLYDPNIIFEEKGQEWEKKWQKTFMWSEKKCRDFSIKKRHFKYFILKEFKHLFILRFSDKFRRWNSEKLKVKMDLEC